MEAIEEILHRAALRGAQAGVGYAGAVLPAEAQRLLAEVPGARLVDVRTQAEQDWVGMVPGSIHIEWQRYPGGSPNAQFLPALLEAVALDSPVLFLCRSGGRSHAAAAAAAEAGYTRAYNVLEGFEGDKDAQGHRNVLGGWRVAGLPWRQS